MLTILEAALLSAAVMAVSVVVGQILKRYKAGVTEMMGMMIGMTQGMMTGIAVGYFWGAATDMFISNLVGVILGVAFGVFYGRVGSLMGMMDGGMGGMMGGMMGAMLGVMLQTLYDGWAIAVTTPFMIILFLLAAFDLVLLVKRSAAALLETDLVCDMKVDPRTSLSTEVDGKKYYFCAPSCLKAFNKNPGAYIPK